MTEVPWCMDEKNGDLLTYSATSAFWAFNQVANWAYTKYDAMLPDIRKQQSAWENYFNTLVPAVDAAVAEMSPDDARAFLTRFSCQQAQAATDAWHRLFEYLLVKYLDGQEKKEVNGSFLRTPYGLSASPFRKPFPEEYLRTIAPEVAHE